MFFYIIIKRSPLKPNPHCFIAKPKPLLVAEKSHCYPTPCTALCGGGGRGMLYGPEDLLNVSYT
jgi:hypothetical protein